MISHLPEISCVEDVKLVAGILLIQFQFYYQRPVHALRVSIHFDYLVYLFASFMYKTPLHLLLLKMLFTQYKNYTFVLGLFFFYVTHCVHKMMLNFVISILQLPCRSVALWKILERPVCPRNFYRELQICSYMYIHIQ